MNDPAMQAFTQVKEFVRRGMESHTMGSTLWLGSSSALNGIVGALSSAILARFLGVADYGIYVLIISLLTLMTDVADLGVSSSIVRFGSESVAEGNEQKLRTVIAIVTRWKLVFGVVLLLCALLFLNEIVGYVFKHVDEQISFYFRLSLLACVFGIAAGLFTPIYQSFKKFRRLSVLLSSRAVGKLLVVVILVYGIAQCTVQNLIWVEIGVLAVFLVLMYAYSPFKRFSVTLHDKRLEREMWSFNKWISLYQAIALIGARLDLAFVGGLSDAQALGLYGSASKVSGLLNAVSSSYMSVLLSELSSSISNEALKRKRRHAWAIVSMIIGGILFVALIAGPLIHLLFGSSFDGAASVLRILCVGLVFAVLAYPINATLFARNKSAVFPLMSTVSMLAFIGANMALVPRYTADGAAMAFAFSAFVAFVVSGGYYLMARKSLHVE